ncbi:MAG: hypothetical protein WCK11_05465 [Candidatus Falkowbacteria bacterium]
MQKIFDDTAGVLGRIDQNDLDEEEFVNVKGEAIYTNDFWIYYSNLEVIHAKMKKVKTCSLGDKNEFENLCRLFSKPYSKEMLELSFKVVNSNVFDRLDREIFFRDGDRKNKLYFNEEKSVLYIDGEPIKIDGKTKNSNQHKILKYIFIDNRTNLTDDFFYSEIAADEFGDLEYSKNRSSWKKYYDACGQIKLKIKNNTKDKIRNFLILTSGQDGKVSINREHL